MPKPSKSRSATSNPVLSPEFSGFKKLGEWQYEATNPSDVAFCSGFENAWIGGEVKLPSRAMLPRVNDKMGWVCSKGVFSRAFPTKN